MKLRNLIKSTAVAALLFLTVVNQAFALGLPLGGSATGQAAGLFSNAAPHFLPMRQVYPAPTGVATYEPHLWAYYKPSTGDTFQWRERVGVSFGRWPYIYQLVSGPPGMAFGATVWSTSWDGTPAAAYVAGYGQLRWTPTAAITSTSDPNSLVSVNVIDQDGNTLNIQWHILTSDDVANGGVFFFENADTGSDSAGNGSKASPWQTLTYAFGTSYHASGTEHGAAPADSIGVLEGATADYVFPAYADNNSAYLDSFQWNPTYKPNALIGYPGQTATIDLSGEAASITSATISGTTLNVVSVTGTIQKGMLITGSGVTATTITAFQTGATGGPGNYTVSVSQTVSTSTAMTGSMAGRIFGGGAGLLVQDISLSGYNTADADVSAFQFASVNRVSFQGITWNNAGYGTSSINNASLFYALGGSPSFGQYLFITGCQENNREAGTNPNNSPIHLLYSYQDVLVELNEANDSGNQVGNAYDLKSDIAYAELRENTVVSAGANDVFSFVQSPFQDLQNDEIAYNIGVNALSSELPITAAYTYQNIMFQRNSLILTNGITSQEPTYNLMAPYTYQNVTSGHPFGLTIAAPSVNTSGGALGAGPYFYAMTTLGASGESTTESASGTSNQVEVSGLSGSTNAITLARMVVPNESGANLYRGTATGSYTSVATLPVGITSFTDNGANVTWSGGSASWNSTSGPPTTDTAVSTELIYVNDNAVMTAAAASMPTTGAALSNSGNVFSLPTASPSMLDPITGLLTPPWISANPSDLGNIGAQL